MEEDDDKVPDSHEFVILETDDETRAREIREIIQEACVELGYTTPTP